MKTLSVSNIFNKLTLLNHTLKLTELRKDILEIFIKEKKPLSAYEVLEKLKKKREKAEPPTVYRVIDYFLEKQIIHRIETKNKYVLCAQLEHKKSEYHGFIFLCKKCLTSFEVMNSSYSKFIKSLSNHHSFLIDSVIEIKGTCKKCAEIKPRC